MKKSQQIQNKKKFLELNKWHFMVNIELFSIDIWNRMRVAQYHFYSALYWWSQPKQRTRRKQYCKEEIKSLLFAHVFFSCMQILKEYMGKLLELILNKVPITWINLENIRSSEISQRQKDKYCMILLIFFFFFLLFFF